MTRTVLHAQKAPNLNSTIDFGHILLYFFRIIWRARYKVAQLDTFFKLSRHFPDRMEQTARETYPLLVMRPVELLKNETV